MVIDILMLLIMLAMAGIGLLIKYTLIPGSMRYQVYNENVELYLFGMDRHQWGAVHLILGYIFLGLLLLHIVLHWKLIVAIYKKLLPNRTVRNVSALIIVLLGLYFLVFGLFLPHQVVSLPEGEGHGKTLRSDRELQQDPQEYNEEHVARDADLKIYGYMSLGQVAQMYQVSSDSLKAFLGIPLRTSDNETFGRLRRKYGFHMSDVERYIERRKK